MKQQTKIIRNPADAAVLLTRLIAIGFDKPIQVVFGNVTKKRTLDQNALYRMSIDDIARDQGNNKEHVHQFYLDEFCPAKEVTFNGVTKRVKSTTLLDTTEMTEYWHLVIAHAATELNVFVRHPNDCGRAA